MAVMKILYGFEWFRKLVGGKWYRLHYHGCTGGMCAMFGCDCENYIIWRRELKEEHHDNLCWWIREVNY